MINDKIIQIEHLGQQWRCEDPFIMSVYHKDHFPKGNDKMGPNTPLNGRNMGSDFSGKDGWSMYHGSTIPGFPQHPHRGFETVTIVLKGVVDHADSTGATGRYTSGDVQWMTAGRGCNHSEMFPLINQERENPLELFQIWLNLPQKNKFVDPHYKMLWNENIPVVEEFDVQERRTRIRIIAGHYKGIRALDPTPHSWASDKNHQVSIWAIRIEPLAKMTLPSVSQSLSRNLYFYSGTSINIDGKRISQSHRIKLRGDQEIEIINGETESYLLLLEGEPIGEPVVAYGPFVMTTKEEVTEALNDYRKTEFGGWPWIRDDLVHPREQERFAKFSNGTIDSPTKSNN